jgi:dethiobiotin synthetase
MQQYYDQFIKEKRFLDNLSERTLKYYGWVFNRWTDCVGEMPNKQNIKEFVIKIQESGVTVYTANSITGIE